MQEAFYRRSAPRRSGATLPLNRTRRGIATVEMAICIPVLLLIAFNVVELCSMMFVKQGMTIAAYEGAHRGLQVGGTAADAIAIANEILEQRRIQGATVTVTPSDIPGLDIGEFFTVEVVAQSSQNRLVPLPLFSLGEMTAKAVAMKEYPADE